MVYRSLGLLLISTFLFSEFSYIAEAVGDDVSLYSGGICESDPMCVCIFNKGRTVVHCESDLHLISLHSPSPIPVVITCNITISSTKFNRDYYSLLKLNHYSITGLRFRRCPEPLGSYASLIQPPSTSLSPHSQQPEKTISRLDIVCDIRSDYSIAKKHLEGLNWLSELTIDCLALTALPLDLFHGTTPNLKQLRITNTRLGHIPDSLFSYTPNTLVLTENRDDQVLKQKITTLPHLEILLLEYNNLTVLGESIFESLRNLSRISLTGNSISSLPRSLRNATRLRELDLGNNSLVKLAEPDCVSFSNLRTLTLTNNLITDIDPQCFSLMKTIMSFDISGNAIAKLPDHPMHMHYGFGKFTINDNSAENLTIKQFVIGEGLQDLCIRNSAVTTIHPETLLELPRLRIIDLSWNMIRYLPEGLFASNPYLVSVNLNRNMLSALPGDIFHHHPRLNILYLSHNSIERLDPTLLAGIYEIEKLDLSGNALREIPYNFFSNVSQVNYLNVSNNKITSLHKDTFQDVYEIKEIDFSYNLIENFSRDILSPYDGSDQVEDLHLRGNLLADIPNLSLPALRYLDLAGNAFQYIPAYIFHNLTNMKHLDLSNNLISNMSNFELVTSEQKLEHLDLSSNQLEHIPYGVLLEAENLDVLRISNNKIDHFSMDCLKEKKKLSELDLSSNGMTSIDIFGPYYEQCAFSGLCRADAKFGVKILNLSNNSLSFNDTEWEFDEATNTWGRVSPLYYWSDAEIILLNDNLIDTIFLDWRLVFDNLKLLDLRRNNFKYLTHQDFMFSTQKFYSGNSYIHSLTVDLRENQIKGVHLPSSKLIDVPSRVCIDKVYGHATLLLEDNPFVCGCGLFNLLRVLDNDVVLTSDMERIYGKIVAMPAKIEAGNLSCWEPKSVQGKIISEPETFAHHLLSMQGFCILA